MPFQFSEEGLGIPQILQQLQQYKAQDLPWRTGRIFAYVYDPGAEAEQLMLDAYTMYLTENALDPTVFPSLLQLENEVMGMACELMYGPEAVGHFTTGGTESIMLALKTARDYYRVHQPQIKEPEIILPHTAHAAFYKGAHYLGLKTVTVPVDNQTFRAVSAWMEKAITPNSILMVGSAPSYAHGVVDPIQELAEIAQRNGIWFHTDACVGGMYLPFAQKLGYAIPTFDFRIPGVCSISMDFHKFGYAMKGASGILYRDTELRKFQFFACSGWAGYTVTNTTVLSTKSGGSLASCWAMMKYWGQNGYLEVVDKTMQATQKIKEGIGEIEGLYVLGKPDANLVAISSDTLSMFKISDIMRKKGWYLQPQLASVTSKENLHFSVSNANVPHIDLMLNDLAETVNQMRKENHTFDLKQLEPLLQMLRNPLADTFEQLSTALGTNNGNLPEDFEPINQLLNQLSPELREMLLIEYFNRMYK
jgi:glutamate/tyrosine decarboxylase-like PLP-dependent enzyme